MRVFSFPRNAPTCAPRDIKRPYHFDHRGRRVFNKLMTFPIPILFGFHFSTKRNPTVFATYKSVLVKYSQQTGPAPTSRWPLGPQTPGALLNRADSYNPPNGRV